MPQASIKLIWSLSSCNFCPRRDVRTCQVKPGKLLPKLAAALDLEESMLNKSEGICTCCLSDIDMIIRAIAIKGAMKDYFVKLVNQTAVSQDKQSHHSMYEKIERPVTVEGTVFNFPAHDRYLDPGTQSAPPPAHQQLPISMKPSTPDVVVLSPTLVPPTLMVRPTSADQLDLSISTPPSPGLSTSSNCGSNKKKDGQTMYQCVLCEKVAGSKSHCMEHLICHSAVRPFACAHCQKTYKSRKACREHLLVMHNVEKSDSQLYNHIIVDQEGLKQLEHVCTQYKKISSSEGPKPGKSPITFLSPTVKPEQRVKEEPAVTDMINNATSNGSKSDWLYGTGAGLSIQTPPPPLIRYAPYSRQENNRQQPAPATMSPPAKRNRKGTPHKVVMDIADDFDGVVETPDLNFSQNSGFSTDDGSINLDHDLSDLNSEIDEPQEDFTIKQKRNLILGSSLTCVDNSKDTETHKEEEIPHQPEWPVFHTMPIKPEGDNSSHSWLNSTPAPKKGVPPCEICGRCFPTKEKMADHKRSHSEIKQFSCLMCNRFFKYRRGVTNHLKEVHRLKDRNEISSLVASHEIGCVPVRDASGKKRWVKQTVAAGLESDSESAQGTPLISQKVILDTVSSLVEDHDNALK